MPLLKPMRIIICCILCTLVTSCSVFSIYKRDQVQGNLITAEMLAELQPGMTREQVIYIMGSPLLADPFDKNQWDYVYQLIDTKNQVTTKRVTLRFEQDRITKIETDGDIVPSEKQTSASTTTT